MLALPDALGATVYVYEEHCSSLCELLFTATQKHYFCELAFGVALLVGDGLGVGLLVGDAIGVALLVGDGLGVALLVGGGELHSGIQILERQKLSFPCVISRRSELRK